MKIVTTFLLFSISLCANSSVLLHQSDWESPFVPTYTVISGSPEISLPTDVFNSQSLTFNTLGNSPDFYYDQIQYDLGDAGNSYNIFTLSFDIYTDSLINSTNTFTIAFDTPTVRNLYFTNNGTIDVKPGSASQQVLTSYNENESMHLDMTFNIALNEWDIDLNNANIYSGIIDNTNNPGLNPAQYVRSIRFSHGLLSSSDSPDYSSSVYLDNVTISAVVPIPPGLILFLSGLLGLIAQSRLGLSSVKADACNR